MLSHVESLFDIWTCGKSLCWLFLRNSISVNSFQRMIKALRSIKLYLWFIMMMCTETIAFLLHVYAQPLYLCYRFSITSQLRQYDAAIMEIGVTYDSSGSIPPRQDKFYLEGVCAEQCSQRVRQLLIPTFSSMNGIVEFHSINDKWLQYELWVYEWCTVIQWYNAHCRSND